MNENLVNQQGQSVGNVYGGNPEPEKDSASTEKPLTIEDVNAAIVAVVQPFIDKLTEAIKGGFATKNDLDSFVNRLSNNINDVRLQIPKHDDIVKTAKEAVPVCLRNLDSAGTPRVGPVLMLAPSPGGAGNADSCYFGEVKAGAGMDWTKVFFGYKFDPNGDGTGNLMRIYAGEVDRIPAPSDPEYYPAYADLTVADQDFIYVNRNDVNGGESGGFPELLIQNGATVPADTYDPSTNPNGYRYYKLYQVKVTNGKGSIQTYCRVFAIEGGGGFVTPFDNTDKKHFMVIQMSADNNSGANDNSLWMIDYLKWH